MMAGLVAAIVQGIRTIIARKPYIFGIFQGVRTPCPPSGSDNALTYYVYQTSKGADQTA